MSPRLPTPLLLALDGSAPRFSLALAEPGGRVVAEEVLEQAAASRTLFAALDRLLDAAGAGRHDLVGIVATRGPGSFTGVRLALSAALGLSQALTIDAAAVGSLEAVAECVPPGTDSSVPIVAAIDALRGEWFVQTFDGSDRSALSDPVRLPQVQLPADGLLVGFGVSRLEGRAGITPDGGLATAALRAFARRGARWDASRLSRPLYLREAATTPARRGTPAA